MGLKTKKILGVEISLISEDIVLEKTRKWLKKAEFRRQKRGKKTRKTLVIFTPNPEIIVHAQTSPKFKRIVNSAQIKIPDGAGIGWAIRKLYEIEIKPVPGVDLMKSLCRQAEELGLTIGLIGGRDGLAVETANCLRKQMPNLKIEAMGEPELKIEDGRMVISGIKNTQYYFEKIFAEIEEKKIDYLFTAFGYPKQEYFIEQIRIIHDKLETARPLVMMGVGGSFNYIADKIPRAPMFLREIGGEWFFRLIIEPWRIKRQIIGARYFLKILLS